jgi:hypothetical protein
LAREPWATWSAGDWEYELTFIYDEDADLERRVEDLLSEISRLADLPNCFIEADLCEKGAERSW